MNRVGLGFIPWVVWPTTTAAAATATADGGERALGDVARADRAVTSRAAATNTQGSQIAQCHAMRQ